MNSGWVHRGCKMGNGTSCVPQRGGFAGRVGRNLDEMAGIRKIRMTGTDGPLRAPASVGKADGTKGPTHGWCEMTHCVLSQVCEINPPRGIPLSENTPISFVPMGSVSTDGHVDLGQTIERRRAGSYTVFQNGDIIFAKITPCMENGKMAIVDNLLNGYGAGSTEFIVLRPNTDIVTVKWLYLFLSQTPFRLQCQQHMTGSAGQKRVPPKYLASCFIPVPPLQEQKRIVAKIEELFSELDNGVETLEKTKQQLAVYRQAVLKAAFEGKLTAHLVCDTELEWAPLEEIQYLPAIPHEWHYVSLSKLGDLGRGKSKHRPRNDSKLFEGGKYPFLQTGEVKAAKHFITTCSKMYGEFGLKQSKLWPKGTLCITIAANIAETAFLGFDACFPDSIVGFTPHDHIVPEYIKYFIDSQKLRLWAFAPATAQKNINLDTLENLIVPYCSVREQNTVVSEIDARMSICDNIEKTVDAALQQAEALRQGILKTAFEGTL